MSGVSFDVSADRTLAIGTSKDYGPTVIPVVNTPVSRTATGKAAWTLKLTRVR